jgi:hypothetical protein
VHKNHLYLVNLLGFSNLRGSHWHDARISLPRAAPAIYRNAAHHPRGLHSSVFCNLPDVLSSFCLLPPPSNRCAPLQLSRNSHTLCAFHLTEPAFAATSYRYARGERVWHVVARPAPRPPRVNAPRLPWCVFDITGVGGWLLWMPHNS